MSQNRSQPLKETQGFRDSQAAAYSLIRINIRKRESGEGSRALDGDVNASIIRIDSKRTCIVSELRRRELNDEPQRTVRIDRSWQ